MEQGVQNLPEGSFWKSVWGNLRNALIGCSAAVVFGLAVLMMSILSVTSPERVFPSDEALVVDDPAMTKVEYYLPYPGMLPDNPMYRLKAVRDKVGLLLSRGGLTRANKELLYADKRIGAAQVLVEGGKAGLGVSTATKAEKYLEKAVNRVINLSREGKDVKSMLMTLSNASSKHAEILEGLQIRVSGDDRDGLEGALKLAKILGEQVNQAILEAK